MFGPTELTSSQKILFKFETERIKHEHQVERISTAVQSPESHSLVIWMHKVQKKVALWNFTEGNEV